VLRKAANGKRADMKADVKTAMLCAYGDSVIQDAHWKKISIIATKALKL
jgi:hypothetical protein